MQTKMKRTIMYVAAAALAMAGCQAEQSLPLEPVAPSAERFGKDTDPRAIWQFHAVLSDGVTQAGITGDGRDVDGNFAAVSRYEGERCGVHAKIFDVDEGVGSGDGVFLPDAWRSKCPNGPRKVGVNLGSGPIWTGPFTNANKIDQMAVGESKVQTQMRWSVALPDCDRLVFSNVSVTRTDDGVTAPRTWRVETTAPHTAACQKSAKGSYVFTGTTYTLPYSITIREVL